MSKKTVNLTRAVSVRLRHDQEDTVNSIIESMTPEQLSALKDQDRSRFKYPELFKNAGRGSSPLMMLMRLALDDYLKKYQDHGLTEDDQGTYQERIKYLEGVVESLIDGFSNLVDAHCVLVEDFKTLNNRRG